MTFAQAMAEIAETARLHGLEVELLLKRLRDGELSKDQFQAEMQLQTEAFGRLIQELALEAHDGALAAIASLKAPESTAKN